MGATHPPVCRIQPRQHQGEDVEAALAVGLLGDAALLQQHGLGEGAETGMSSSPQPPACRRGQPLGAGRVASVPGWPGTPGSQGRERTVAPRDGEMLLGAVKEGLDFSL